MIIIDTGALSSYCKGVKTTSDKVNTIGLKNFRITPVIFIEFRTWLSAYKGITKQERAAYLKYIKAIPIIHIDKEISNMAIEIANENINAKLGDTLIAATCLVKKIPILTNDADFKRIKGIKLI